MATRTLAEQATETLKRLGVVGQGQNPSDEDQSKAEEAVTSAYRQLRNRGLANYASSTIPEEQWDPLERYVAASLGEQFGRPYNHAARHVAEEDIRRQSFSAKKSPGFVARGKYH